MRKVLTSVVFFSVLANCLTLNPIQVHSATDCWSLHDANAVAQCLREERESDSGPDQGNIDHHYHYHYNYQGYENWPPPGGGKEW